MCRIGLPEGALCHFRRAGARCAGCGTSPVVLQARCAGVLRRLVVLIARYGQRDHVLGVVPIDARYAGCDRVLGVVLFNARYAGRDPKLVWSAHADGERAMATGTPNTPMQPTASRTRSLVFEGGRQRARGG
jgi:hypothetical protein